MNKLFALLSVNSTKLLLALIGFALVAFTLQVTGPLAGIFAENTNPDECKGKVTVEITERSGSEGSEARIKGKVTNNCDKDVEFWIRKFWCESVKDTKTCGDNPNDRQEVIKAHSTYSFDETQKVGNNGSCGSAQIDVRFARHNSAGWPNEGALAWKQDCRPRVRCERIEINKVGTGMRVQVKVFGSVIDGGKIDKYAYDFGDPKAPGREESIEPDNGMKHTYTQAGTYAIQAWVVGENGKDDSSVACKGTVTFEQEKHFVCESNACVEKAGPGDTKGQCETKCAPQVHFKCMQNACAKVNAPGQNQDGCKADNVGTVCGVQQFHFKCVQNACAKVNTPGQNQDGCKADNIGSVCGETSYHFECQNNACAKINTAGQNKDGCSAGNVGTSCNQTYLKCENNACKKINGSGQNQDGCVVEGQGCGVVQYAVCDNLSVTPQSGNDPVVVTAALTGHTVNGGSIVSYRFAWGDGTETVTNNSSTAHTFTNPGTYTLYGFVTDNKGNQIGGSGSCRKQVEVECTDCGEKTHAVCIDNQCQIRSGDGPQSCSSDCGQAHHVCRNESCQYVAGPLRDGDVTCSSDTNCRVRDEQHLECRNSACVIVDGSGSNTCSTDANCKPSNPTHTVCQNQACVTIAGSGSSQCVMSSDCVRPVVYENIPNTGPEMPILGGLFSSGILGWFIRKLKTNL